MDRKYVQAMDMIRNLKIKLKVIYNDVGYKELEDKISLEELEGVIAHLENAEYTIRHYSMPIKEGILCKMSNGKFELISERGDQISHFGCGDPIECYVDTFDSVEWCAGRVEYNNDEVHPGYYFYCSEANYPLLRNGTRARIRVSD